MNSISDFLSVIKSDLEIQSLIAENNDLKIEYHPRTRGGRSKSRSSKTGIALKYFWTSLEGAKLRTLLESKYGVNISNKVIRGKIKDALHLYLIEYLKEFEDGENV